MVARPSHDALLLYQVADVDKVYVDGWECYLHFHIGVADDA